MLTPILLLLQKSTCTRLYYITQSCGELERARIDAALAPAVVDTWPYRARNTLFYAPDGVGAEESNDGTAQVPVGANRAEKAVLSRDFLVVCKLGKKSEKLMSVPRTLSGDLSTPRLHFSV